MRNGISESWGPSVGEMKKKVAYGSSYERDLLLPVVYEGSSAERLVGDDDDGVSAKRGQVVIESSKGKVRSG